MKSKNLLIPIFGIIVIVIIAFLLQQKSSNSPESRKGEKSQTLKNEISNQQKFNSSQEAKDIEVIAENLKIPWEIVFLPDGDMLVSERIGTIKRIGKNNQTHPIEGVKHHGEGGLLGMVLHPNFVENHWLYLYFSTSKENGTSNRVERYSFENDQLQNKTIILENIPGAIYHDGGRIAFGPDGMLYITTGDATQEKLAQDKNSLAGKILRLTDEGGIPDDNPFSNAIYSYGHRNPQGLAWDDQGQLWATEHGRSGITSGYDELNRIEKGANYGWPTIEGDKTQEGMKAPILDSGARDTWAPASLVFSNDSLFFGGLRGESLYEVKIKETPLAIKQHFHDEYGRIRAVTIGPDEMLYISTSNTDNRGKVQKGDDKIIRINPKILQ